MLDDAGPNDEVSPRQRLQHLRGVPCPHCALRGLAPLPLAWTGVILRCDRGHGYSNPAVLRSELLAAGNADAFGKSAFTTEKPAGHAEKPAFRAKRR